MNLTYEVIQDKEIESCRDLCYQLMAFQKTKAYITPELFDDMNLDTRMVPSINSALHNYIVVVKDKDQIIGYVYSNISPKEIYSNDFATFFDLSSVRKQNVGCLSQFFIKEEYREYGVGSKLFKMSMAWLNQFDEVEDYFIFVSNGNDDALKFYKKMGFVYSNEVLDGFITTLRYPNWRK